MKTRTSLFLMAVLVIAAASVMATSAPRVSLTLKNGDRIQCELIDLGGVGFTVRNGGATAEIPANDVALIEFTGSVIPRDELSRMQAGRPFITMRNGDIVMGRLIDIGGNDPLRLTVRTENGDQDFSSNDVARVFLATWAGLPAASMSYGPPPAMADAPGRSVTVPATECWTRTGLTVQAGQRVAFIGSGEIQLSDNRNDTAGLAGSFTGRYAMSAPIPSSLAGALIGRIGDGRPFGIGDQRMALSMPGSGELWLGINDDHCADNRGEFRVRIEIGIFPAVAA